MKRVNLDLTHFVGTFNNHRVPDCASIGDATKLKSEDGIKA